MKYLSLVVSIFALVSCYEREAEKTGNEGKTMPSFGLLMPDSVTYLDTKTIQLGKPTVLFFYSPQCPYCTAQIEEITKNINRLKNIQFFFITNAFITDMKHFIQKFELSKYPNIKAGRDTANFLANYFEVQGVPYMAIYGKNKKLNRAYIGMLNSKQIEKAAFN